MRRLDAATVLDVWERAWSLPPVDRALTLWAAGSADTGVATAPIGERERGLLAMRTAMFGPGIDAVATCPSCGELVEIASDLDEVVPAESAAEVSVDAEGYRVTCRLPSSEDIAAVGAFLGAPDVRDALARRCVVAARRGDAPVDPVALPPGVVDAIENALADADPCADIRFDLSCPGCEHRWDAAFDAGSYLWSELDAHARRLAADVHVLASAYGWSETDILSLSPTRRQLYVEVASR